MAYGSYKNLIIKIEPDKVLRDKAFKIAGDTRNNCYQRGLDSALYKFF